MIRSARTIPLALLAATTAAAQPPVSLRMPPLEGPIKQIGSSPTDPAPVRKERLLGGLEHPWAIAWLPNGDMLITERPGRLRLARGERLRRAPIEGLPGDILAFHHGGLLDLSLHPAFERNRLVYLTYSAGTLEANRTTLARARFEDNRLHDLEVIWRNSRAKAGGRQYGSRVLWLPDSTMLLSVGDGGNPPDSLDGRPIREFSQDLDSHFGKVVHLHDDGTPVPGGPYADTPGALPELWAIGLRNIQGMVRVPGTGAIWAADHGAQGGDELNLLEPGVNYGWPIATYSREYAGPRITETLSAPGMRDPAALWTPCIAPGGMCLYTGDAFPAWKGDLLIAGLRSRSIHRVTLDGDRVAAVHEIPIGHRVRQVAQGPDGLLYVLTDEERGAVLRLSPE